MEVYETLFLSQYRYFILNYNLYYQNNEEKEFSAYDMKKIPI